MPLCQIYMLALSGLLKFIKILLAIFVEAYFRNYYYLRAKGLQGVEVVD